jgi:ComF family protein
VLDEKWPLVPVPLHRSRLEFRHFNQALEIAGPMGRELGLPVVEALRRIRATETQTRLTRNQRLENLRGAFKASAAGERWPQKAGAVLVDDVLTTGSTVDACAKALKKAGFRRVFVVTVMRG